jgi:hypothetical protein
MRARVLVAHAFRERNEDHCVIGCSDIAFPNRAIVMRSTQQAD